MAKTVKMCDMNDNIAALVLQQLNPGKVSVIIERDIGKVIKIITSVEPKELVYPEGWYYSKGHLTNKHNSSTGVYWTVNMHDATTGEIWNLPYCTAD